jgi:hypothetical protein
VFSELLMSSMYQSGYRVADLVITLPRAKRGAGSPGGFRC